MYLLTVRRPRSPEAFLVPLERCFLNHASPGNSRGSSVIPWGAGCGRPQAGEDVLSARLRVLNGSRTVRGRSSPASGHFISLALQNTGKCHSFVHLVEKSSVLGGVNVSAERAGGEVQRSSAVLAAQRMISHTCELGSLSGRVRMGGPFPPPGGAHSRRRNGACAQTLGGEEPVCGQCSELLNLAGPLFPPP